MTRRPSFEELASARLAYENAPDAAERAETLNHLETLRAQLGEATDGGLLDLSDEQLDRRIATLSAEIEQASAGRISATYAQGTSMGMGGGGGLHPVEVLEHNARLDRQTGRDALVEELQDLVAERERRATPATTRRPSTVLVIAAVATLAALATWFVLTDDDPAPTQPRPLEIASVTALSADEISIRYAFPCRSQISEPVVEETAEEVLVTVTVDRPTPDLDLGRETTSCSDVVTIALTAPLGDRVVIDRSFDREVPVVDRR